MKKRLGKISLGPFLSRSGETVLVSPELERTCWQLELSGEECSGKLRIYREVFAWQGEFINFSDYLVRVIDLSWNVTYAKGDQVNKGDEVLIRLETALSSLYRDYEVLRPLPTFMQELRDCLPLNPRFEKRVPGGALFVAAPLRNAGFEVTNFFPYGTGLTIGFGWVFPQDRDKPDVKLTIFAASIEFRPGPGRILGKGKWLIPYDTHLAWHFGTALRGMVRGRPEHLFSEQGIAAALEEFPWKKVSLLTRDELQKERIAFVRQHPDLHDKPTELARALRADGLWSDVTQLSEIARQLPKILLMARV